MSGTERLFEDADVSLGYGNVLSSSFEGDVAAG